MNKAAKDFNEISGNQYSVNRLAEIRAMTYNIRHGKGLNDKVNIQQILEVIQEANVDIVCLQEVDRFQPRSGFTDQVGRLAKHLGMYSSFSRSVEVGVSQYGNAILSKYPIMEHNKLFLPGYMERRSLLHVKLKIGEKAGLDTYFHVINLHLGVSVEERRRQFPLVLNFLKNIKGPAIFMGDLNMKSKDPLLKPLFPQWKKIALSPPASTYITGKEIDHIYLNFPVKPIRAFTIKSKASDHLPVVARVPLDMLF